MYKKQRYTTIIKTLGQSLSNLLDLEFPMNVLNLCINIWIPFEIFQFQSLLQT